MELPRLDQHRFGWLDVGLVQNYRLNRIAVGFVFRNALTYPVAVGECQQLYRETLMGANWANIW